MEKAFKMFFLIIIAGVALFVWRLGAVQKLAASVLPANSSSTASVSRFFPPLFPSNP